MSEVENTLDDVLDQKTRHGCDEALQSDSLKTNVKQPAMDRLVTLNPALKYLGFSLLMAYHYVMWFNPCSFFRTDLLTANITTSWLFNLAGTALVIIGVALSLGRKKHLSDKPWMIGITAFCLILITAALLYGAPLILNSAVIYVLSFLAGGFEGLMWILWGETLTQARAKFSVVHIGVVFGATVLVSMLIALIVPADLMPIFILILITLSAFFLYRQKTSLTISYPVLLPRDTVKPAFTSVMAVCSVGCVTGIACYYLVAIVPWEQFVSGEYIFVVGVVSGALLILLVSGLSILLKAKASMFKLFPYFLVFAIVGLSIFLSSSLLEPLSFVVGLSVSSLLEVSLIMYFGTLMQRGFFAPALAVALSVASVRIGIALGNCLGLFYEMNSDLAQVAVDPTTLIFICVLAFVLVPIVRCESRFVALTTEPVAPSEIDTICNQIIAEFKLSDREGEILKFIARGNTVNSIASKLVISPHTVNTHIRHIYDKVGIHKRGELLEYINMKKEEKIS